MMSQSFAEGFGLGLSLSMTCVATCGPVFTSYLLHQKSDWYKSLIIFLELTGARFIAYALFGLGAGFIGRQISDFNRTWFSIVAYLGLSVFLIISALRTHRKDTGCQMKKWSKFVERPFILGLVTGVNFCPSFLIAVTNAVNISGPIPGLVLFIGFFFGSNLPLFGLPLFGVAGNIGFFRTLGKGMAIVVGVFFIVKAGLMLNGEYKKHQEFKALEKEFDEKSLVTVFDDTQAYILSTDTSSFTRFRELFQEKREGSITMIASRDSYPDSGYVLVDPSFPLDSGETVHAFKRPGIFAIILPKPLEGEEYGDAYTKRLITFLDTYYFKLNKEQGSLFNMSGNYPGKPGTRGKR